MIENSANESVNRPNIMRFFIALMNVALPGIGLLRVGELRLAAIIFISPYLLYIFILLLFCIIPVSGYFDILARLSIVFTLVSAIYFFAFYKTWKISKYYREKLWWSRWYVIVTVIFTGLILSSLCTELFHSFYKPYYIPSFSMLPTFDKGDKFVADMRWRGPIRRGQIIIFRSNGDVRVSRVVATAGDRVAMRSGVPIVNGIAAVQTVVRRRFPYPANAPVHANVLVERSPGDPAPHRILDLGPNAWDDMAPVVVPAKHLFVLGDNRDQSADSRVPADLGGVGMVPISAIVGQPMYIHWSSDHSRIGVRLNP